jgi:transcriptional regulator with XRE-family HTH domain
MGKIIRFPQWRRHARTSSGHKSGRNSVRETPVSFSIDNTNSAGTPRLDFVSQYQTWDCVVPMRTAKDFCPPAAVQARLSASLDMGQIYPKLGYRQPKNMSRTPNLDFGRLGTMKEVDPIEYGERVRERRIARKLSQARLGKLSGYSQTNIGWIEQGRMKRPRGSAEALSEALCSPKEYLLWGTGPKEMGPIILSEAEIQENYSALSPQDRAAISAAILERIEAAREKLKIG